MQTSAHTTTRGWGLIQGNKQIYTDHVGEPPLVPPNEIIQWIRVYKNPLTVPVEDLTIYTDRGISHVHGGIPVSGIPNRTYDFSGEGIPLRAYISPSFVGDTAPVYWVKFDGETGELFEDEDNPRGSGLVTATENTAVTVGDIVAIAVHIQSWGGICVSRLRIGPRVPVEYTSIVRQQTVSSGPIMQGKWNLYPNVPLVDYRWTNRFVPLGFPPAILIYWAGWNTTKMPETIPAGQPHTLVYQFKVTAEHVALNTEGPWIGLDWETESRDITHPTIDRDPGLHSRIFKQYTAFDWIWDEAEGVLPRPTSVKPFNTFEGRFLGNWGGSSQNTEYYNFWGTQIYQSTVLTVQPGNQKVEYTSGPRDTHRHVPLYDPLAPPNPETGGLIYYPKIELADTPASTEMDVPGGTQTGAFTVTLRFSDESSDESVYEGHNLSDESVAAFQTRLTTALAAGESPWTVTSLTYAGGVAPLSLPGQAVGDETRYTLTLAPPLGMKGEVPLVIPADMVLDAAGNGNLASGRDMVDVDTSLRLAGEVVEPEGLYSAGDALEVLVPFAEDGLTYDGDAPPYITIYLGEGTDNPRHATWQKGEESAGSTIVPFRYVVDTDDPIVTSVRPLVSKVLVPEGTTLVSGAGLSLVGTEAPPMDSGEAAPAPSAGSGQALITTASGATPPAMETEVTVLPTPPVYLPPDESAPKAGLSSVPRSPLVFNELGNGSGAENDWLELRNVTGDAVSLKDWELSVVQDGKKEDTSLVLFPDVSVPADGLLLITNSDPTAEGNLLAGGDDIATADVEQKGSSHLYLVNAGLSLPDDGQFLLILRNTKEKLGLNEAFVDVAGGGGSGTDAFIREQTGLYDTYVWPLQVLEAPESATEDALSAGKVWLRAKVDIVGYHRDAWGEAAFTGVGYDRNVLKSAETAGTPGYPNGAVKTEAPTPRGAITISEVMLDSAGGTLPQWIELYNASKTDALNLNRWELEIQNVDSEELVGRPIVRLTLQEKVIQPNQTLLIVTGNARASSENVFPADRVYNLLELHDKNLRIKKPSDTFLSAMGFYLRLTDRNENTVDEVGNTDGNRRTDDTPAWALPIPLSGVEGMRSSLIRRYDKGVARDGTSRQGWALAANFARFKADGLHYGHADDIGTPGYRQGGALPVELSSFSVTRLESGSVIVTWTTESEVDNAGFNLRRSLTRENGFTLLNPVLIAGAGTTGERQTYTFIDTSAKPGVEHYYQLEEVSFGGKPETLVTRRLRGPVSASHRALKTLGEVKQREE